MSATPSETTHDVVAIGSAIVDVLSHAEDDFLTSRSMAKGTMALIEDEADAEKLYGEMGPGVEASGGSAANTVAGVASFGGRAGFIGRVRDDQLGRVFAHDIRAAGVDFRNTPATEGPSTARCLVLITPDAQRTMHTYLGIAGQLSVADLDVDLVSGAAVLYCEGYLWDRPETKTVITRAMDLAHDHGRKVAFTLSDPFCVDRHRAEFRELAEERVDILFANEAEICSLYEVDGFDEALQHVRHHCEIACLTRSEKGSVIVSGDEVHVVDATPRGGVVDTTGAGDLYAAGFLHGHATGHDLVTSGRLGSLAAGEVIAHVGARPEERLADLAAEVLR
ncbi:MAG: adenosine kinase [Acidimicrobiia bacterium]|nr:adenosine kinase [Acidimicrobiia bacterium]